MAHLVHIRDSLGPYLCGELSPAEEATFESHLLCCPTCRTTADQLSAVVALIPNLPPHLLQEAGPGPR